MVNAPTALTPERRHATHCTEAGFPVHKDPYLCLVLIHLISVHSSELLIFKDNHTSLCC